MTSKERIKTVLEHKNADTIAMDFGATTVTGMHCRVIEELRRYYGLEYRPVKISEPYQMLGNIEDDLARIIGFDCIGVSGEENMFGIRQEFWKEVHMPWGQTVQLPGAFHLTEKDQSFYVYPQGDQTMEPSGVLPPSGFFFNGIERQEGELPDSEPNPDDNLEEFGIIGGHQLQYWETALTRVADSGKAIIANFGGMGLGDVALLPGMNLKKPKGIRRISDWYMATVLYPDFVKAIFDRQTDIALHNLDQLNRRVGHLVDIVYICGTDFGTQNSQFCSPETFQDIYLPYYRKMNDWIHRNTSWKTFKHSCGAILPLMEGIIEAGFDIINPVQINAKDMDPRVLKANYGKQITFWGGGVDTQKVLPYGTKDEIRDQIYELCDIFGRDGGFVFSSVHNVQANVPVENVVTMLETINEIRRS